MALTDEAIAKIRSLIQSGELPPGARLPPEPQLAAQMGLSRSGVREAVKVLESARVLDVRRGDGTYVTSLAPRLLLEGLGVAVELLRDDTLLEVMEVRRLLEPMATGLAAVRMREEDLDALGKILEDMRAARDDAELLIRYDTAFHRTVIAATGNETLTSLLEGLSSRTIRARVWRGLIEGNASHLTLAEHEAIYNALCARDQLLAQSTALLHVNTSEVWLRTVLAHSSEPDNG
ncbi:MULTISPECIES: FadR/GntR family transcriptional regulator [Streptomyces]|uniref:FadR/GntR family transcriptional regulator n=1 Tax=Streptomyces eurythermus TaxID=42237 RepID=A0ABW6YTZ9_9ACTN|nr:MULTISPECIES: FadR/GntR family transcriptional regulator [Streptomyces]QIS69163.1 FadR family transcriptional regulator [Streptomyces sp. DSM 40868]WDM10944.1 FadR family transcriptional regulator [Streptomyces lavenduligriseus]